MTIREQVAELEVRLVGAGFSPDDLCREAEMNRSTWTRWKSGVVTPNLATWQRANDAAESLISSMPAAQNANEATQ